MRVEDGFLRSQGLGSNFVAPASLVFDEIGLYFDESRVSTLDKLLNEYIFTDDELVQAKALRKDILKANLTKYNVGSSFDVSICQYDNSETRKKILVVGQVEGDQSILKGCRNISSNSELLREVKATNSDAVIVFKPHPDVESGNRKGAVDEAALEQCVDKIETKNHLLECLDACDELHTMTSLSGFEPFCVAKRS